MTGCLVLRVVPRSIAADDNALAVGVHVWRPAMGTLHDINVIMQILPGRRGKVSHGWPD